MGLGSPTKQASVKNFVKQSQIDLVYLVENKLNDLNIRGVAHFVCLNWFIDHNLDFCELEKVMVCWNPNKVSVQILFKGDQLVHCLVNFRTSGISVFISFVYAHNSAYKRRLLWNDFGKP